MFVDEIKRVSNAKVDFKGASIDVTHMKSILQRTRNFYIGEALKLILAKSPECGAAIKWVDRTIYTPDNVPVFCQPKKVVTGEFKGSCATLSFVANVK